MKKDNKFQFEALTYDDVLLIPSYSEVVPSDTIVSFLLFWPGSSITCQAQENKKTDSNRTKKPLYILNKKAF